MANASKVAILATHQMEIGIRYALNAMFHALPVLIMELLVIKADVLPARSHTISDIFLCSNALDPVQMGTINPLLLFAVYVLQHVLLVIDLPQIAQAAIYRAQNINSFTISSVSKVARQVSQILAHNA